MKFFPSDCLLQRRVVLLKDGDDGLAAATNLHLSILECKDRKADGFADDKLQIYNRVLETTKIGVRLLAPLDLSSLAILGARSRYARVVAVDKAVIVIALQFADDVCQMSYLIYDADALSLRLTPVPDQDSNWVYTFSCDASIARTGTCHGDDVYALVHTALQPSCGVGDLHLWRPSLPKPEHKKYDLAAVGICKSDTQFSFSGHAYWVDLLVGVSYCSCDAFFVDNIHKVEFRYTPLPVGIERSSRRHSRVAEPVAYRTMGVVCDSFIRFVSIDGFQNYVELKKRTVTVWKLLGHLEGWEKEHELSLETLWGFKGFDDLPRDLTPMYPLLSNKDADVVYLVLGKCRENQDNWKFIPCKTSYILVVNMREKIITSALPLVDPLSPLRIVSCGFSPVGHCDEGGITMKKRRRRRH